MKKKKNKKKKKSEKDDLIRGPWSWTEDDIKLLKQLCPDGNWNMIAEMLNRPLTAVRQKAYDMGLTTDVYKCWTDNDLKILKKLYPKTRTEELAEQLGRSAGSVKTKARQLGLKKSQNYMRDLRSRPRKRRK